MNVSIIVPTFDEPAIGDLVVQVDRITTAAGLACEVIVVDDSPGSVTRDSLEAVETTCPVRFVHRPGTQRGAWGGLSGAVLDGFGLAEAPLVLVMDGDGQHPPQTVPALVGALDQAELAIASRYTGAGDASGLADGYRRAVSSASTLVARGLFPARVGRRTTDPMTGFFAMRRSALDVERAAAHALGFKVLLAILVTHPDLRTSEVSFEFGNREAGESKASWRNGTAFLRQLVRLRVRA